MLDVNSYVTVKFKYFMPLQNPSGTRKPVREPRVETKVNFLSARFREFVHSCIPWIPGLCVWGKSSLILKAEGNKFPPLPGFLLFHCSLPFD